MRYRSVAAAAVGSALFSAYVVAERGLVLCVASISEKLVRLNCFVALVAHWPIFMLLCLFAVFVYVDTTFVL